MRKASSSEQGFTLIELLVVIAIIAIITAIAVPALLSQRQKGVDAKTRADVKNIATSVASLQIEIPNATHFYVDMDPATNQPRLHAIFKPSTDSSTWVRTEMPTKLSKGTHIALVTSPAHSPMDPNYNAFTGGATGQFKVYAYNPAGSEFVSMTSFLAYDSYRGGMIGKAVSGNPNPSSAIWFISE